MARKIGFWLGIIVTIICLYFVFRGIEYQKLSIIVSGINIWLLLSVVAVYIFGYYIRAIRWHYLLKHIKELKPGELFPYLIIGFMANNILPARAGEAT